MGLILGPPDSFSNSFGGQKSIVFILGSGMESQSVSLGKFGAYFGVPWGPGGSIVGRFLVIWGMIVG